MSGQRVWKSKQKLKSTQIPQGFPPKKNAQIKLMLGFQCWNKQSLPLKPGRSHNFLFPGSVCAP